VVLAVWACGYLLDCVKTVAAPGRPLDVVLPTGQGAVRVTARDWSLDWRRRVITADAPALYSAAGDRIAAAERVVAAAPRGGLGAYVVRITGLSAGLERLRDGSWRHSDLLPRPTGESNKTPYVVEVDYGSVTVRDDSGSRPWTGKVNLAGAKLSGVGDRWLASGTAELADLGSIEATLRRRANEGIDFDLAGKGLRASSMLAHLSDALEGREFPALKRFRAASLTLGGKAAGTFSAGRIRFEAQVEAGGAGLAFASDARAASAQFAGTITESGAVGRLSLRGAPGQGSASGSVSWRRGVEVLADVDYSLSDTAQAPSFLRRILPGDLKIVDGRFSGRVSYGGGGAFQVDGDVTGSRGGWAKQSFVRPSVRILATRSRFSLEGTAAQWLGGRSTARIDVELATGKLNGAISTRGTSLAELARSAGSDRVSGRANVQAILGGTITAPEAVVRASATARPVLHGRPPIPLGGVDFSGRYTQGRFTIERLAAAGPAGVFTASGVWNIKARSLDLDVFGNGVLLSAFQPDAAGTAIVNAHVVGPASSPRTSGRVEAFGIKLGDTTIPFVGAAFDWNGRRLQATELTASKGPTTATGQVSWNQRDGSLSGVFTAKGIELQDWLKDDLRGSVSVTAGRIYGTADRPKADMSLEGGALVADGLLIDTLKSRLALAGKRVTIGDLELKAGSGTLAAHGYYDGGSQRGEVGGSMKDVPIDKLFSAFVLKRGLTASASQTSVAGSWSGDFDAKIDSSGLAELGARGNLRAVAVNGAKMGDGDWQVGFAGAKWSGSLALGDSSRYLRVPSVEYDTTSRTVSGEVAAHDIGIHSVLASVARMWLDTTSDVQDRLESLDGSLDFAAKVAGTVEDPKVDVAELKGTGLAVGQAQAGALELKATRANHVWKVANLAWTASDGNLVAHGKVDERGDVDLDGELSGFRLGWLGEFSPDLAKFTGTADVPFLVSGPVRSPVVTASLKGTGIGFAESAEGASSPGQIEVNLTSISLRQGDIQAEGAFSYRGISGNVSADVPFEYPFRIPEDRPLHAEVTLPRRPLSDLADYADWIDFGATEGSVEGAVQVDGNVGALKQSGSISVKASKIGFRSRGGPVSAGSSKASGQNLNTSLQDLSAIVTLHDRSLDLDASARGSGGGSVAAHLETTRLDPMSLLQGATQELLELPLSGSLTTTDLSVDETVGKQGHVAFKGTSSLTISGQIRSPLVAGSVGFADVSGTAPSEFPQSSEGQAPAINPRFQVALSLAGGARLSSSATEVFVDGSGSLGGSLTRPSASMDLNVERGTIQLPNAKIRVEPGGTMQFGYRIGQEGMAEPRLDVNMRGDTWVTALQFGDNLQRYAVRLHFTGDLLQEGQLQISAQSDPPDLSQDRIMAILGQGDLIEALAHGNGVGVASYAIPVVLNPLTQRLASELGLDYLNLEYDVFQRTTLSAARSLGRGFSMMARRQISESTAGPQLFNVRLSYSLSEWSRTFRSFSLGVETDQDEPWKFIFEYGTRF
jgi:hypothetical protein